VTMNNDHVFPPRAMCGGERKAGDESSLRGNSIIIFISEILLKRIKLFKINIQSI